MPPVRLQSQGNALAMSGMQKLEYYYAEAMGDLVTSLSLAGQATYEH